MSDTEEAQDVRYCPTCGAGPSFQLGVWESPNADPKIRSVKYIGCTECLTMREVDEDASYEWTR